MTFMEDCSDLSNLLVQLGQIFLIGPIAGIDQDRIPNLKSEMSKTQDLKL
jgi:hypothetical protein